MGAYLILWKLLLQAPNGLPQWISVRAPTEPEAIDTVTRIRPEWALVRVEREKNP